MSSLFCRNLKIIFPAEAGMAKCSDVVQIRSTLLQAVQNIGMPQLRRNLQHRGAATGQELFMKSAAVIQHDLIPAHKQKAGRKVGQISK